MQEQESDSPLIENNPAVADIQTIDSPIQHTTDGRKVICSIYFYATSMNQKFSLIFVDVNVESPEPIQPDITGASSVIPTLQTEATTENVLYLLHHPFCYKLIQTS